MSASAPEKPRSGPAISRTSTSQSMPTTGADGGQSGAARTEEGDGPGSACSPAHGGPDLARPHNQGQGRSLPQILARERDRAAPKKGSARRTDVPRRSRDRDGVRHDLLLGKY